MVLEQKKFTISRSFNPFKKFLIAIVIIVSCFTLITPLIITESFADITVILKENEAIPDPAIVGNGEMVTYQFEEPLYNLCAGSTVYILLSAGTLFNQDNPLLIKDIQITDSENFATVTRPVEWRNGETELKYKIGYACSETEALSGRETHLYLHTFQKPASPPMIKCPNIKDCIIWDTSRYSDDVPDLCSLAPRYCMEPDLSCTGIFCDLPGPICPNGLTCPYPLSVQYLDLVDRKLEVVGNEIEIINEQIESESGTSSTQGLLQGIFGLVAATIIISITTAVKVWRK